MKLVKISFQPFSTINIKPRYNAENVIKYQDNHELRISNENLSDKKSI